MKEAYCSYEVSKLLKDKGFDEHCDYYYDQSSDEPQQLTLDEMYYSYDEFIKAPTHQMAMAWLREKKYISIVIDDEIPLSYKYIIKKYSITELYKVEELKLDSLPFVKYEDAVEAALKYTLKNLI